MRRMARSEDVKVADTLKKGTITRKSTSVDGRVALVTLKDELISTRSPIDQAKYKDSGFTPIQIGKPVVIQFLRFVFQSEEWESGDNELMISTFLKKEATKAIAAEAISYYDPEVRPSDDKFVLDHFGAKNYGHPLIYYTKSYTKETLFLTVQVMELDKVNTDIIKEIKETIDEFANIPIFSAYLPYFTLAKGLASLYEGIANWVNKDDKIIPYFNIDLYPISSSRNSILQSGVYVCVPRTNLKEKDFIEKYKIDIDTNMLISKQTGEEFNGSYFVFKVNSETVEAYSQFDYFLNAAELLSKTNRGGGGDFGKIMSSLVEAAQGFSDLHAAKNIESKLPDKDNPDVKQIIEALYNGMSPEMKKVYKKYYDEQMGPKQAPVGQ